MKYRAARGMRDVLPSEVPLWERLEAAARRLALLRGYREIRPPLLEETDLFIRSVGEVTDIVEKEMFTLVKGDTSLTLRPEGTAGVVRAYVQAGWAKTAPLQRLFTIGPMFRYERPQKGRERQFTQFDVECIGSHDPRVDAEIVDLAASFFEELGLAAFALAPSNLGLLLERRHLFIGQELPAGELLRALKRSLRLAVPDTLEIRVTPRRLRYRVRRSRRLRNDPSSPDRHREPHEHSQRHKRPSRQRRPISHEEPSSPTCPTRPTRPLLHFHLSRRFRANQRPR